MNKKLYYTVIAMVLITAAAVIFVSNGKISKEKEEPPVKTETATDKQLVKPDDVIEEAIIGNDAQEVVGIENIIM